MLGVHMSLLCGFAVSALFLGAVAVVAPGWQRMLTFMDVPILTPARRPSSSLPSPLQNPPSPHPVGAHVWITPGWLPGREAEQEEANRWEGTVICFLAGEMTNQSLTFTGFLPKGLWSLVSLRGGSGQGCSFLLFSSGKEQTANSVVNMHGKSLPDLRKDILVGSDDLERSCLLWPARFDYRNSLQRLFA